MYTSLTSCPTYFQVFKNYISHISCMAVIALGKIVWLIFYRFLIAPDSSLWKCRNDTYQIHSHSLTSSEEHECLFKVYVTHSVWGLWSVKRTKQDSFEKLQCKWSNAKLLLHRSRSLAGIIWHSSIEVRLLPIHAAEG